MRILIRTDIGGQHGLGHASRCRALARELAARGASVEFVTRTEALRAFVVPYACHLQSHGLVPHYDVVVYDTLEPLQTGLLDIYSDAIDKNLVVIDHLDVDAAYCALAILPNMHTPLSALTLLRQRFGDRLLAGSDYVLLDQEVTAQPAIPYEQRTDAHIAFCAGGSDPSGVLNTLAQRCGSLVKTTHWVFLLPACAAHPYIMPPWAECVPFARHWLREAALVVTTMGQTVYEALYLNTPVLIVGHTDRHCEAAQTLWEQYHPAVLWCDIRQMHQEDFVNLFTDMCHGWGLPAPDRRMLATQELIDGRGVQRVAERILAL